MNKIIDKHISVHHIGGRSGSRAFPVLSKFEKDIINVIYDADADCVEQIRQRNQKLESRLHVLPYCLSDAAKSKFLNINYDPYTSSFYELNPDYKAYNFFYSDHDYILSQAAKTMERRCLNAVSMDSIFERKDISLPPPDFLSIDTQGAEYEILQGAKEALKSDVLALVIETEFHPIYKDQKLFGDLTKLLSDYGFDFAKFLSIQEMSAFRAPVGLRGGGFQVSADALFLRKIDTVVKSSDSDSRRFIMLRKLAFIAAVFNQFEYGLECLRQSKEAADNSAGSQRDPDYLSFLRDLEDAIAQMPQAYPATFISKFRSFQMSKSRFEKAALDTARHSMPEWIKQILRQMPIVYPLLKYTRAAFNNFFKLFCQMALCLEAVFCASTKVEKIFLKYGLISQAKLLKKNRIIQRRFLDKTKRGER